MTLKSHIVVYLDLCLYNLHIKYKNYLPHLLSLSLLFSWIAL